MTKPLQRVPADVRVRLEQERDVQAKAIGQILKPVIERIDALERCLDRAGVQLDEGEAIERQASMLAEVVTPYAKRIRALEQRLEDLSPASPPLVKGADNSLLAKLVSLERRLAEVEKCGIKYQGTYQRSQAYVTGDAVTSAGSLWVALEPVDPGETPGNSKVWRLACKRGRDGRNASGVTHRGRARDE